MSTPFGTRTTARFLTLAAAPLIAALSLVPQVAHAQAYTLSTLASFNGNSSAGAAPYAGVTLDSSGNIYGTAHSGGANNLGTVFEIAAGTNTFTTLTTFTGKGNGEQPSGPLTLDSSGNFYGTTSSGGTNGDGTESAGTLFKIAAGTGTFSTLATFTGGTNGANPYAGVTLDSSGNLYGTTYTGGASNLGTVFEIAPGAGGIIGTGAYTTLATFNGTNGARPETSLTLDSSGNLYGTTAIGGASGAGTVFKIAAGTNTLTTLATFTGLGNGQNPLGSLTLDSSGNLFGTTSVGGANNFGTVFKIAAGTNALTTLVSFNNTASPDGGLTLDSSGNLFGTTSASAGNGPGTVFEIAAGAGGIVGTGAFTTLVTFNGTDGRNPIGNLALDSSGSLYGTTEFGGPNGVGNGLGTVFKLTPTGSASAPEPSALLLLAPGLPGALGLAVAQRRRKAA